MFLSTMHFKDMQPGIKGYGPIFAKGSLKERETGKKSFSGLYSHWVSSKHLCCCVARRENSLAERRTSPNIPTPRILIAHPNKNHV